SDEALRRALPKGASIIKFPDDRTIRWLERDIVGFAFMDGKFAAYIFDDMANVRIANSTRGESVILGEDGDGNWVYVDNTGELKKLPVDIEFEPPVLGPNVIGNLDNNGTKIFPGEQVYEEGYRKFIRPLMKGMRDEALKAETMPLQLADAKKLTPAEARELQAWGKQVANDFGRTKLQALHVGEGQADMALLNYNRRTRFDNAIAIGLPYVFWTMHTAHNWAIAALDRPALLAHYARWLQFISSNEDEETYLPSRVKGKFMIPAYGLSKELGNSIFYDPLMDFFPVHQWVNSATYLDRKYSEVERTAIEILRQRVYDKETTAEDALAAIQAHESGATNDLWDYAVRLASQEREATPIDM
ncbi:hypothetical protein, partial [Candidatus Magnetobacterium casense]